MLKVVVCIGSSCHLKGSRQIIENWQNNLNINSLNDEVELSGTFCMGKCNSDGVSVKINDEYFTVKPENASDFFNKQILKKTKIN